MKILFTEIGWDDYRYWVGGDRDILGKVNRLIEDMTRNPFRGIGKPEPLKGALQGFWSRRITGDHRFVYKVEGSGDGQRLVVVACRYHYED